MPRGGPRNRYSSGPAPDPRSLRSAKRADRGEPVTDYTAVALPRDGYRGQPPAFGLLTPTSRELELWAELWRTPQAAAWASEPWRWRTVGQYVRWSVRMEQPDAAAALAGVVVRLGDQIGLTPAGLRENGWTIAREAALRPAPTPRPAGPDYRDSFGARSLARDRFTVVEDLSAEDTSEGDAS